MRSLEEILEELNAAEKEYQAKCREYGIEEKTRKKKIENSEESNEEGN